MNTNLENYCCAPEVYMCNSNQEEAHILQHKINFLNTIYDELVLIAHLGLRIIYCNKQALITGYKVHQVKVIVFVNVRDLMSCQGAWIPIQKYICVGDNRNTQPNE